MALAVSLRRALMVLLTCTILLLMVLYWNEGALKSPTFMAISEKSLRKRSNRIPHPFPAEKLWTYKCENDKCIRNHYIKGLNNGEKRVPFTSCAMLCGDVKLWPAPTVKAEVSSKSLKFVLDDMRLQIETPFQAVRLLLENAFNYFLTDLRRINRMEETDGLDSMETADKGCSDSHQNVEKEPNMRNQKNENPHMEDTTGDSSNGKSGHINNAKESMTERKIMPRPRTNINNFKVHISVQKFPSVSLDMDTDESYYITTTHERRDLLVNITANSFFGAKHGLATLLQLIWFDDEDNVLRTLSKANIIDAPKFRYRGLMLDTSRHFFSVEAIKRTIAGMAHSKLNRFHWHISDTQSFPYVSKYYPELAAYGAYSDHETYTPEDVQEIVEFAKIHGIQVIPEIDSPAHAGNGWDWGPKKGLGDLSLCINQHPWSFYCGEPPCGQLNPKNNNTYLIMQRLFEEMVEMTGTTDYFHLGGDEVNLECWAQHFNDTDLRGLWCDFTKQLLARLKIANNNVLPDIVSVWSSGLTNSMCLPKSQFAVQIWGASNWQENYDLLENGFNVLFSHVDAWYLDCGFGNWRSVGEAACSPYRTWQTVYKHRPWKTMRLDKSKMKQVLGGEACLWTEQVDEEQLDNRLWPRSGALGERLWSDPNDEHEMDIVSQSTFERMSIFRNRLVELGFKAEPIFPKYCAQNPGECI